MLSQSNTLNLSTVTILKQKGMVILSLAEYEKLRESAIPTYYLKGKEAEELDDLVREGRKEYNAGKTIKAESLNEALKIYERRNKNK
ncbi:MAG: hypothetical protein COS76_03385 [Candidatus Portnoybacteria bacterium CG06_land_8_20_14_3_00_39_12]|uniref:Uncharacterized protein n=1 Tax=Candidatus Portnoybacteria bacterium CG06_land_8_20_14_3_00_39_12 TaxID=1974809 RepID=A0A2M7AWG2_9BACT|nr:MAG: hypothetical protein COS76_03385 [Candidatus Portnoybacteria bacterium CG06_land_8_20_14_3_00_39_12]